MKDDAHLIETGIASENVFDGALLHITRDTVRLPDGSEATREFIKHPGAVMVIPLLDDGSLLMERQFRYPFNRVFLEFPAGKLDAGEDPLACGKRELLEETGYTARHWKKLGVIHPIISYTSEEIHIFLAEGLVAGDAQLDEGEFLELVTRRREELVSGILDGSITDGKTVAGVFWLEQLFKA